MDKLKKHLLSNLDILCFFFGIIFLDCYFRYQLNFNLNNLRVIIVDIFISLFFCSFLFLFGKKARLFSGVLILSFLSILCFCQNLHYNYFSTFFSFSKASILQEFFQVKNEAAGKITIDLFVYFVPLLIFILCNLIKGKQIKSLYTIRFIIFITLSIFTSCCLFLTFTNYSDSSKKSESDNYLYESLYNKTRAVERLGLYSYTLRDAQLTLINKADNIDEDKAMIDIYIEEHGYTSSNNEFTGLFKGKNLILVLCESLSSIVIDEELTPTLYKMKTQGINFNNHYAPVYQSATADSEFMSLTSQIPSIEKGPLAYDFYENVFPKALPIMFKDEGYSANSFHSFKKDFYNRETLHYTYGFTYLYDWVDLNLEKRPEFVEAYNWIHDRELFKKVVEITNQDISEPFFDFVISVSGHIPYVRERYELEYDLWQTILLHGEAGEKYSTEALCYLAAQKTLDTGLETLIEELDKTGQLENTVIAIYGDHYPYGLTKSAMKELFPDLPNDYEINKVPFIIWTPNFENPITIDEVTSTYDIMPTLCNLFNLSLEGRFIVGRDALSQTEGIVIFEDRSWLTDRAYYDATKGNVIKLDPTITDQEIEETSDQIFEEILISQKILSLDYYAGKYAEDQ
ncbi:LTA synthase family protein [Holdemania massiliensis]|uniref:LTA synthase family protein n=1 Tax=Holdemania massiliensis TaxID=1468449 RepID=UPI001F05CA8E|nr:LTA synthase family protein [Holdemania massiliensis]MCH1940237.1 LTA synthase family protein [Holdemania massiliensis]